MEHMALPAPVSATTRRRLMLSGHDEDYGDEDVTRCTARQCLCLPFTAVSSATRCICSRIARGLHVATGGKTLVFVEPQVLSIRPFTSKMRLLNTVRGCSSKPNGTEESKARDLLVGAIHELRGGGNGRGRSSFLSRRRHGNVELYKLFDCGCNVTRLLGSPSSSSPTFSVVSGDADSLLSMLYKSRVVFPNDQGEIPPLAVLIQETFRILEWITPSSDRVAIVLCGNAKHLTALTNLLEPSFRQAFLSSSDYSLAKPCAVKLDRRFARVKKDEEGDLTEVPSKALWTVTDERKVELAFRLFTVVKAKGLPPAAMDKPLFEGLVLKRVLMWSTLQKRAATSKKTVEDSMVEDEKQPTKRAIQEEAWRQRASALAARAGLPNSSTSATTLNPYLMIINDADVVLFASTSSTAERTMTAGRVKSKTAVVDEFGTRVPLASIAEGEVGEEEASSREADDPLDIIHEFILGNGADRACVGDLRLKFYHQQQQQQGTMGKQELFNLFVNTGALEWAVAGLREKSWGSRFLVVCDSAKDMQLKPMLLRQLFPGEEDIAASFKVALEFGFSKEFIKHETNNRAAEQGGEERYSLPSTAGLRNVHGKAGYIVVCPNCWQGMDLPLDATKAYAMPMLVNCPRCSLKTGASLVAARNVGTLQASLVRGLEAAKQDADRFAEEDEEDESVASDEEEYGEEEEKQAEREEGEGAKAKAKPPHAMLSSLEEMFPWLVKDEKRRSEVNMMLWTRSSTVPDNEQVFNEAVASLLQSPKGEVEPAMPPSLTPGEFVNTELLGLGTFQGESRCVLGATEEEQEFIRSYKVKFPFGVAYLNPDQVHPMQFEENVPTRSPGGTLLTHSPASVGRKRSEREDSPASSLTGSHNRRHGIRLAGNVLQMAAAVEASGASADQHQLTLDEMLARSLQEQEFLGGGGGGDHRPRQGTGSMVAWLRASGALPVSSSSSTAATVLSLPLSTYKKKPSADTPRKKRKQKEKEADEATTKCLICQCAFEDGESLRTLPCFHQFHSDCVDSWLLQRAKCPLCKTDISSAVANMDTHETGAPGPSQT